MFLMFPFSFLDFFLIEQFSHLVFYMRGLETHIFCLYSAVVDIRKANMGESGFSD